MRSIRLTLFAVTALTLAACDARDPVADEANNVEPAEIEALPPDESAATPTNELQNGVADETTDVPGGPIPASMHGRWALSPGDCTSTRGDAKGLLVVRANEIRFYESVARPVANIETTADSIRADFGYSGEGTTWTRHQSLDVQGGNKLVRTESSPMSSFTYARCTS